MEREKEIYGEFLGDEVLSVCSYGDGHINDTFLLLTRSGKYICQRVRRAMNTIALERNYLAYVSACKDKEWIFPEWMRTRQGEFFYTDGQGDHWRMYPFLEGEVVEAPLTKRELLACGKGLARIHGLLQGLPESPCAVYPQLHDLRHYYEVYLGLLERKGDFHEECRDHALEETIRDRIGGYLDLPLDRSKIVHGDTKLANILFRGGRVAGFLDLDTIMRGSLLEDIADCVRSCCIVDGKMDEVAMKSLLEGYMQTDESLLTEEEADLLPKVIGKLCFELALRYYTDYISKTKQFRENYPGYRLEKAKTYLQLDLRIS